MTKGLLLWVMAMTVLCSVSNMLWVKKVYD